jgi:hypothetical protein
MRFTSAGASEFGQHGAREPRVCHIPTTLSQLPIPPPDSLHGDIRGGAGETHREFPPTSVLTDQSETGVSRVKNSRHVSRHICHGPFHDPFIQQVSAENNIQHDPFAGHLASDLISTDRGRKGV